MNGRTVSVDGRRDPVAQHTFLRMLVLVLVMGVLPLGGGGIAAANGAPTISGIDPPTGSVAGGETVTITGTNFVASPTTVTFGGVEATPTTVTNTTTIEVVVPERVGLAVGRVDVTVTVNGIVSDPGGYYYRPAIDRDLDGDNLVVLGELASRSQARSISRTPDAPYFVFGTDSRSGQPYSYETDVLYSTTAGHGARGMPYLDEVPSAYGRESDERAVGSGFTSSAMGIAALASFAGDAPIAARDDVMLLTSDGGIAANLPTSDPNYSFGAAFGPEIYTEHFYATDAQALAFDWAALAKQDDYEIYAFLVAVDASGALPVFPTDTSAPDYDSQLQAYLDAHTLVAHGLGYEQDWRTSVGDVPANGYYRFRFVNGTYDATGGTLVGSNMYIDSVFIVGLKNAITFPSIGSVVGADGADVVVDGVEATSGDEVTIASLNTSVCTATMTAATELTVSREAQGTCTLVASQGSVGDYAPAQSVTRTFEILGAATAPGAPTISGAVAEPDSLEVSFVPPASDGGSPITNYEYSLDGGSNWQTPDPTVTSSPLLIDGLTAGATYQVRVRAVNDEGAGAPSNVFEAQTTAPPPPVAPTLTVRAGNRSLALTVTPQGEATNVSYRLDGGDWVTRDPASLTMPWTIAGLTNGQSYVVEARALDGAVEGAVSDPVTATPVAPAAPPPPDPEPTPEEDPPPPEPDPTDEQEPPPPPATVDDDGPTPDEPVRSETGTLPEPGDAEVEVGGERQAVATEPTTSGGMSVTGDGFVFEVEPETSQEGPAGGDGVSPPPVGDDDEADDPDGDVGADADLVFTRGRAAQVRAQGFRPDSSVRVWLFSEPRLLGEFQTDSLGSLEALTDAVGDDVTACRHTLHAEGTLTDGRAVRLSLGVWVDADPYPFDDVSGTSVHRRAIACLNDLGVVQGKGDGVYDPAGTTTRGQVASMFARWFGLEASDESTHADAVGTTHEQAIAALVEAGVAQGFDADTFGPDLAVTRGQFVSMLVALLDLPAVETAAFSDAGRTHAGAIGALADTGSVTGFEDGTFRPGDPISRAQAASIIVRQQLSMQ